MRTRFTQAAALAGAWLPFLMVWVIFAMVYGRVTFAFALPRSAATIGSAALLGIAVTSFCARTPWPREMRVRFYARHFFAGAVYAIAWIITTYTLDWFLGGTPPWRALVSSPVVGWQFLMGLWLYGLVAGISYAMQTRRQAYDNERRALQAEASLATARLDALRSRLHPHFLFNALHTVAALVRHEPAQAENAIEKLGDMLRYTLQEASGETVPFSEEWEFTRRYLDFEQLRYGPRLDVATTIDPTCMTCSAPSFALQTLVENAVQHSIATRPEGGRIEITAKTGDDQLHVRVRDDGGAGLISTHNGSHYGLSTLRERLHAIYGSGAELAIRSDPQAFEASFTIPCTRGQGSDDE